MSVKGEIDKEAKKVRPSLELYRPGRLKASADGVDRRQSAGPSSKTKSEPPKVDGSNKENGRGSRKGPEHKNKSIGDSLRQAYDAEERQYILEKEGVLLACFYYSNLKQRGYRRRKVSQSSSHSGTFKMENRSNTYSRKNSFDVTSNLHSDDNDQYKRNNNRRMYANEFYNSAHSLCDDRSMKRDFEYRGSGRRNDFNYRSRDNKSERFDNSMNMDRDHWRNKYWRENDLPVRGHRPKRFDNYSRQSGSEVNSRQSENIRRPESSTKVETEQKRQSNEKTPERRAMTLEELCKSVNSFDFESFDWSSEVEAAEIKKKEREERRRMQSESSLPTESKSSEYIQDGAQSCSGSNRHINHGNDVTQRDRSFRDDKSRHSYTSEASSFNENDDEQCVGGTRTREKTNNRQRPKKFRSVTEGKDKGCYLDEELEIIIKDRGKATVSNDRRVPGNFGSFSRTAGKRDRLRTRNFDRTTWQLREDCVENQSSSSSSIRQSDVGDHGDGLNSRAHLSIIGPYKAKPSPNSAVSSSSHHCGPFDANENILKTKTSVTIAEKNSQNTMKRSGVAPMPPKEWPIHLEISRKEGPEIKILNDKLNASIARITKSADVSACEEILHATEQLSSLYFSIVTRNIEYTFAMNLEQHLWKQCFHTSIEALRAASSSDDSTSQIFRDGFAKLVQQGISFYARLLSKYEKDFGFRSDEYLYWENGLPKDDFKKCVKIDSGPYNPPNRDIKVALLSLQRLTVSLGDLHRYNAIVSSSKDYSTAKLWYSKAAQLGAANGKSYNQLALLALYSSNWIDVIFNYTRALAARHPFETARQPLFTGFDSVQKKVNEYQSQFNAKCGDTTRMPIERADRPDEIWIAPDGRRTSGDYTSLGEHKILQMFNSLSAIELFRCAVTYLIHTAGLLVTKIGMESYESVSERALFLLSQLIARDECPVTSQHLIQLSALFLYAVHCSSIKNLEPDTCSLQQQHAVRMVLSLLGVLLQPLNVTVDQLTSICDGSTSIPSKIKRILPAVFVISEWLSMPSVNRLYSSMPSLEPIETSLTKIDTWRTLANVANNLVIAESSGHLSRSLSANDVDSHDFIEIILPESVFLASFIDVFPIIPKSLRMWTLPEIKLRNNSSLLALHGRLSSVLSAAEYLDGSGLPCFGFDENLKQFAEIRSPSPVSEKQLNDSRMSKPLPTSENDRSGIDDSAHNTDATVLSNEHLHYHETLKENQLKKELLDRETKSGRIVIEVKPKFLVPDTNAFIDHLESIKQIAESGKFDILVPITVLDELTSLSNPIKMKKKSDEVQDSWVTQRSGEALKYLSDSTEKKQARVFTLTSKGTNLGTLRFFNEEISDFINEKTVNDDLILKSCVSFSASLPTPKASSSSASVNDNQPRLFRSVVLLTEDRALNIKAVCANIPCRTVPSFMKWASFN